VVGALLALYSSPRYLEIGVSKGITFHAVPAARKVAVDPRFRFDPAVQPAHPGAVYHQVTSDTYFGSIAQPDETFEVIFLDGQHTFEQTLRDLLNALAHLAPGGVILIDDVIPSSYPASMRSRRESIAAATAMGVNGQWMGDVYRLVFFIDSFFQQLTYRTVSDNHGQLVAWREPRPAVTPRRVHKVARLPYEQVVEDREVFRLTPLSDILVLCREQLRRPASFEQPAQVISGAAR